MESQSCKDPRQAAKNQVEQGEIMLEKNSLDYCVGEQQKIFEDQVNFIDNKNLTLCEQGKYKHEVFKKYLDVIQCAHDELKKIMGNPNQITVNKIMQSLCRQLNETREALVLDEWKEFTLIIRKHEINFFLQQDPFTARGIQKPRGYAGDAKLLDHYYYNLPENNKVSLLGSLINNFMRTSQSAYAVRRRAEFIGKWIDHALKELPCSNLDKIKVLSVASGHAREISTSCAFFKKEFDFFALDQDEKSLNRMVADYSSLANIHMIHASIGRILKKHRLDEMGKFDLVYAAGLFDYLRDETSVDLIKTIVTELLKANGRLIVANAMPHHGLRGYMEAFMDWNLIHRDIDDMEKLAKAIPVDLIKEKRLYRLYNDSVVYLEIICPAAEDLNYQLFHKQEELSSILPLSRL